MKKLTKLLRDEAKLYRVFHIPKRPADPHYGYLCQGKYESIVRKMGKLRREAT